jgi:hypothetical protein
MPKAKKKPRKTVKKRGPKEERLVMTPDEAQATISRMLSTPKRPKP